MDLGLRGKTAIVTGGAKGIGSGCSEVLAQEGCNVVVVSRSDETLVKAFADGLSEKYGVKTLAVLADVSKPQQIDGVFDKAIAAFGQVDILINNAGGGVALKPFEELTDEEWAMAMDSNLNSAFMMSRRFIKECKAHKRGGHIVNVLAKAAIMTNSRNNTSYIAAKGGMTTMTRGLANEVIDDGIYVNGIVPGYVATSVYQPGSPAYEYKKQFLRVGWATPRDMGTVAAFLCSPVACQVVGAVVDCSGGTML